MSAQRSRKSKNNGVKFKSDAVESKTNSDPSKRQGSQEDSKIWAHPYFTFAVPIILVSICYAMIAHASVKSLEPLFGYVLAARYVNVVSVLLLVIGWMSTRYYVYRCLLGPAGSPHLQKLTLLEIDNHQTTCFTQISICAIIIASTPWTSDLATLLVAGHIPPIIQHALSHYASPALVNMFKFNVPIWLQPHLVHSMCLYPASILLGCVAGRIPAATALPYVHRSVQSKHLEFSKFAVPLLWFLASNLTRSGMQMFQMTLWNPHCILAGVSILMGIFVGTFIPCFYKTYSGISRYSQIFFAIIAVGLAAQSFQSSPHLTEKLDHIEGVHVHNEFRILSKAGHIQVFYDRARDALFMRAAHSLIGGVYRVSLDSVFAGFYLHDLHRFVKRDQDEPERLGRGLVIGYGVGVATQSFAMINASMDVVDIDRNVIDLARAHFPLFAQTTKISVFEPLKSWTGKTIYDSAFASPVPSNTGEINFHIDDGRTFIERLPTGVYDFMIHDVFTGGAVPSSLFTYEMLVHARRVLRPGGTLSLNFVGTVHTLAFRNVAKTIRSVFPHVACYSEAAPGDLGITNILFLARDRPIHIREPLEDEYLGSEMRWYALTKLRAHVISMPPIHPKSIDDIDSTSIPNAAIVSTLNSSVESFTNEQEYFDWRNGENATAFIKHQDLAETTSHQIVLRVKIANQESSKTSKARARPRVLTDQDSAFLAEQLIPVAQIHWEIMRQLIPLAVWLYY